MRSCWLIGLALPLCWFGSLLAEEKSSKKEFEQLGQVLIQLGQEPQVWGDLFYQVTVTRENWPVYLLVSLGADQSKLWLECRFPTIDQPDSIPSEVWQELLAENGKIAPAHFVYRKEDRRIHLFQAIEWKNLEASQLRKEMDRFDAIVRKTYPIWGDERFHALIHDGPMPRELEELPQPNSLEVSIEALPEPREVSEPELAPTPREVSDRDASDKLWQRLQGKWKILSIEIRGEKASAQTLKSFKPTLTFKKKVASLKSGVEPEKSLQVQLDTQKSPQEINFADEKNQIEKGIFNLDDELLTICFASPGEDRPVEFATQSDKNHWLLVLRKD